MIYEKLLTALRSQEFSDEEESFEDYDDENDMFTSEFEGESDNETNEAWSEEEDEDEE